MFGPYSKISEAIYLVKRCIYQRADIILDVTEHRR